MENKRLYSPKQIKEVLDRHGFTFSKGLGQNFLIDGNIVRNIVKGAGISKDDYVLEIGPGMGTLTEELALNAKKVVAIEIDKRLEPILEETLKPYDNAEVVFGDVLKLPLRDIINEKCDGGPVKVVANLPYYVTTPIIIKLLEEGLPFKSITVMVQKEVADRMVAKPHSKDYGSLTLFVGYYTKPEIVLKAPKSVFMPQPKIDSSVIKLVVRENLPDLDSDKYFKVVRAAFLKRRKTLLNSLSSKEVNADKDEIRDALKRAGIDEGLRAENLDMDDFIKIAKELPNI